MTRFCRVALVIRGVLGAGAVVSVGLRVRVIAGLLAHRVVGRLKLSSRQALVVLLDAEPLDRVGQRYELVGRLGQLAVSSKRPLGVLRLAPLVSGRLEIGHRFY